MVLGWIFEQIGQGFGFGLRGEFGGSPLPMGHMVSGLATGDVIHVRSSPGGTAGVIQA